MKKYDQTAEDSVIFQKLYFNQVISLGVNILLIFLDIVTSAEGSVMVNYGGTIIIAAIKSEVSEPDVNEPENGFLGKFTFNFRLCLIFKS